MGGDYYHFFPFQRRRTGMKRIGKERCKGIFFNLYRHGGAQRLKKESNYFEAHMHIANLLLIPFS